MALYPKAKYRPVTGLEKDPPIIPIGVILHTRAGTGPSLFDYFNGPSGGVESHMYLTFDGKWEQYRDTEREADANLHGNSFVIDGKRYGFISVETEGGAGDDWTPTQLAELKAFIAWASKEHGFPLRVCPAWNKAGVGYHTMWGAPGPWTPVAKDCPGKKRIAQFNTVIVPWMKNPTTEGSRLSTLDADDKKFLTDLITKALGGVPHDVWAYKYKDRQALSYLVTGDANARSAASLADVDTLAQKIAAMMPAGGAPAEKAAVLAALDEFFAPLAGGGK